MDHYGSEIITAVAEKAGVDTAYTGHLTQYSFFVLLI